METVKMPVAVQTKAGTVSRNTQTGLSDQSQSFVKLLQEKKDMAEPDRAQTKNNGKKPDPVQKKEDKPGQTAQPEKEVKTKVPETGEEQPGEEDMTQEALLQAGMWQAAVQLTGMLNEDAGQGAAGEEVLISPEGAPDTVLETAAVSQTQELSTVVGDSREAAIQAAAEDLMVYQTGKAAAESMAAAEGGTETEMAAEAGMAVEPGSKAEAVKPADTHREAEAPKAAQTREASPEPVHAQTEVPDETGSKNQNDASGQERDETWQFPGRDMAVKEGDGENQVRAKAQSGVSQTGQDRKAEEIFREPVYRADSVREPSWQSFGGQKTEEIPLRTSQSHLPQDLGKTLAARLPGRAQELVIELEPAALGKLTIKLAYEGGRAAVSILASNPRTLETLSQRASEIAAILEEKTGQDTIIYTHAPEQQNQGQEEQQSQGGGRQEQRQERQKQQEDQHQTESFAQQLRLGLI